MITLDLIFNLSLLVALSIVSGFIEERWPRNTRPGLFLQGVLFGGVAVVGMLKPLHLGPGLIFDGRSIMVSLCALFFGHVASAIAVVMTIACRLALGGAGTLTGSLVILSSAVIGLLARRRYEPDIEALSTKTLYVFGLAVHIAMLAMMLTLPEGAGFSVIRQIGLPVILFYPLATILTGKILSDQIEAKRTLSTLQESEKRLVAAQRLAGMGDFTWDVQSGAVTWSETLFDLLGYDRSEPIDFQKVNESIHHPDDVEKINQWLTETVQSGQSTLPPKEYRVIRKDGNILYVRTTGIIDRTSGTSPRVFATLQDITEQVQTDKELHETAAILQTAMDCSTAGIAIADTPDGRLRYVNQAGLAIRGRGPTEVVKNVGIEHYVGTWNLLHFDGTPYKEEEVPLARAIRNNETCEEQFIIRSEEGDRIVWASAAPVHDAKGEIIAGIVVFPDITSLKQTEAALREALLRQEEIVRAANVGLWDWDLEANTVSYSAEWKRQIGYAEHDISDDFEEWRSRVHPDDLEPTLETINQSIAEGSQRHKVEFRFCHRDGTYRWILAQASILQDENGHSIRMLGSHIDITDQKKAEKALQESEEKYRLLIENANDAICIAQDGVIKFPNFRTKELVGYSEAELEATPFSDLIHPEDRAMVLDNHHKRLSGQDVPTTYSFRVLNKAGKERVVELSAVFVTWEDRPATLNFLRDITQQRLLETQVRQAQKMESVGRLAGGIA
ncbi:MAG: PAS domain S-box protein, partial [Desulfohalobiaceae bacterium]|nr:PAS domain S-box protein [Desulfohalobiaceae bacterium]